MAKIFISYKYADNKVLNLPNRFPTTVRDYVDLIQDAIGTNHINKGEQDGEDLSHFKEQTVESKLRDKIYDSSVTIVLISPGMKEPLEREEDQWIPWEIAYSLRESTRNGRTSHTNAMLAVVLPDFLRSYQYFIEENTCRYCNCTTYKTNTLFRILSANMFNRKNPEYSDCPNHIFGIKPQRGYSSYIHIVKWNEFIANPNHYIEVAKRIRDKADEYNISKTV
ncbi:TIR domain-containing protein [Porphyromonas endodontalis]|uniref:TIR domain-containing protein n=1 Tax=Porphyromonas endodontalis TaxID=28124 RepID=UPI0028EE883D|nr:TIR domain-containing protein [Porphyromonas endodontalis]